MIVSGSHFLPPKLPNFCSFCWYDLGQKLMYIKHYILVTFMRVLKVSQIQLVDFLGFCPEMLYQTKFEEIISQCTI